MGFADDIRRWNLKVENLTQEVFVGSVAEVKNSIVEGSPITGSPGQPVGDDPGGDLRASWQTEFEDPHNALVSTSSPYAESNEDGIARPGGGQYIQRSAVGGRWSVAQTRAGFQNIVDDVAARFAE